ncbi:MAG: nitrous oxide reductase family maturation protein NosD, partial [Candidatus Hermodarchaeota archaeon]
NTILRNEMNKCGLGFYGLPTLRFTNEIDTTNLVNGKPLYYYANALNLRSQDFINAGQVILVNCTSCIISNLNVSYTSDGISLYYSKNNTISGNTAKNNNFDGIKLSKSYNNTVTANIAKNNYCGIYSVYSKSDNNDILGNTVINNHLGIRIYNGKRNNIIGNSIDKNEFGLYITHFSENTTIYLNNFTNNIVHFYSEYSTNIWTSQTEISYLYKSKAYKNYLGNYWDNYTGIDVDNNGIGDTPFIINEENIDYYPLMEPIENYEFANLIEPLKIPFELIILISIITGGALIGIATYILIDRKKRNFN